MTRADDTVLLAPKNSSHAFTAVTAHGVVLVVNLPCLQSRVSGVLARLLVEARARLAERWARIEPVLWDINHLDHVKQTIAAGKIQRVYRGHCGRFRANIRRTQLKLALIPKVT